MTHNCDPNPDFATPNRSIFQSGEKSVTVGSAGRCDTGQGGLPTQTLSPAIISTRGYLVEMIEYRLNNHANKGAAICDFHMVVRHHFSDIYSENTSDVI